MQPYSFNLPASEFTTILTAMRKGLFYANECAKAGMIGADEGAERISAAIEFMGNQTVQGGFENDAEKKAYFNEAMSREVAAYGSN